MNGLLAALHADAPGRKLLALCGGGGKTTLLHLLAREANALGWRSVICSSTHILKPEAPDIVYLPVCTADHCRAVWEGGRIVAAGQDCGEGKITLPDRASWDILYTLADIIVCEADGAKKLPVKFPAPYEPVLPAGTTHTVVVAGLSALGQPTDKVLHRAGLAREAIPSLPARMDETAMARLLLCGYGRFRPQFVLNQADDGPALTCGRGIARLLAEAGFADTVVTSLKKGTLYHADSD